MRTLILLLLLAPVASFSQSPFDGTWVLRQNTATLSQKPVGYSVAKGVFRCSGCIVNLEVQADGYDHKVAEADYWDTVNVQIVDEHAIAVIAKKNGKTMYTEIDAISFDGSALTQVVKDTTEADTVTIQTQYQRIEPGAAGAHPISGSWRSYKTSRSSNGSIIKYSCTASGFSGETPLGEKFDAKFDGNFYPVEDDPGNTMVSARLVSANTVELTHRRKGKIVSTSHMLVAADGKSIHVVFENKETNSTATFDLDKLR